MEHEGCNYYAILISDWVWFCNKCGWMKLKKNDQGI